MPLVSVVMPAYNAARFVEAAIRSVMAQTVTDWELLVLDDGSTDDTCQIVEQLAAQDPRIHLLPNGHNMGVARTRNRGFELCRGSYVALLDSDDLWHPDKLEKQLTLAETTGAEIVYCSYGIVDENGQQSCGDFIVPSEVDFEGFLARSVISCSTALLSREVIKQYRFATDFYHEDLDLWLRLLRDGYKACGAVQVLAQYRVMQGSRASNKLKSAWNRWRIYRESLGLSFGKSAVLLVEYAVLGLKKYKRKRK